jgi:hypothetical protein
MTNNITCEQEYDFALILDGIEEVTPELADAFCEAGCDDATLGMQCGVAQLEFSRNSTSMKEAILSAMRDVSKVGRGVTVRQIDDCNLVTPSEMSRRIGCTRQMVHHYITGHRGVGRFPSPLVIGNRPYWAWCEVSYWLFQNNIIKQELLERAEVTCAINAALDRIQQQRQNGPLVQEIEDTLKEMCGS